MGKHEFLNKLTVLRNIASSFDFNVFGHTIILVIEMISKVKTHGRAVPQRYMSGSTLSFFRKATHFVLHFLGSGSVLNFKLCRLQ